MLGLAAVSSPWMHNANMTHLSSMPQNQTPPTAAREDSPSPIHIDSNSPQIQDDDDPLPLPLPQNSTTPRSITPIVEEHSADVLQEQILNEYQDKIERQEQIKLQGEIDTIKEERQHLERQIASFARPVPPHQREQKNKLVRRLVSLEKKEQLLLKNQHLQKQKEKNQKLLMGTIDRDEEQDMVSRGIITPFEAMQRRKEKRRTTTKLISKRPPPQSTSSNNHRLNDFRSREERNAKRLIKFKSNSSKSKPQSKKPSRKRKRSKRYLDEGTTLDDGDQLQYAKRMKIYHEEHEDQDDAETATVFNRRFKVPSIIWDQLFDYQQTCIKWLWELHQQGVGGIVGDEMGTGKTVQTSAFLGSLHHSGLFKSALIMCPATVMRQWVRELHKWWPQFRVAMYHSTGSSEDQEQMVLDIASCGNGILITTYDAVRLDPRLLVKQDWGYVILDEGHRLKNPDSEITLTCKHFQTPHRLILTGTPIQNNLKELWSLFDFVYPGKLGTLPVFQSQFGVPISMGGYANASQAQVETAYQCAVTLRDLITPYLLRRVKKDVHHDLPQKDEKVLFCKLTDEQVHHYRQYLKSQEVQNALDGTQTVFQAVLQLRRICNHPKLANYGMKPGQQKNFPSLTEDESDTDQLIERSGKLKVVDHLLGAWKKDNHRILLFSQSLKMLDILELYLEGRGFNYRRMDGTTQIKQRMTLIDEFNNDEDIFVFLLTTKVGGIGVNLTGADRVILYDPDWNPSVDQQSLERCWRIGQEKEVVVYRLMTQGTIEEKIYHRQIFKTFLTNKILSDPRQKRFFKQSQLYDLFTLGKEYDKKKARRSRSRAPRASNDTETGQIFSLEMPTMEKRNKERKVAKRAKTQNEKAQEEELYRVEDYMQQESGDASESAQDPASSGGGAKKETFVLQQLFNSESVGSVFDHDKIISKAAPEADIVEREASKIAQMAAQKLLESSMECRENGSFEPTWTGASGSSGQPERRFGRQASSIVQSIREEAGSLSSASLLSGIRSGASGRVTSGRKKSSGRSSSNAASNDEKGKRLIRELIRFLKQKGGKASSQHLVGRFKSKAKGDDAVLFRCMLKEIAQFDKERRLWILKQEFRQRSLHCLRTQINPHTSFAHIKRPLVLIPSQASICHRQNLSSAPKWYSTSKNDEQKKLPPPSSSFMDRFVFHLRRNLYRDFIIVASIGATIFVFYTVSDWFSSITFKNIATWSFSAGVGTTASVFLTYIMLRRFFMLRSSKVFSATLKRVMDDDYCRSQLGAPVRTSKFRAYSYYYPETKQHQMEASMWRQLQFWKPIHMQMMFKVAGSKTEGTVSCDVSKLPALKTLIAEEYIFHSLVLNLEDGKKIVLSGTLDEDNVFQGVTKLR